MLISKRLSVMSNPNDLPHPPKNQVRFSLHLIGQPIELLKTSKSQFGTAEMESRLREYYEKQSTFNSFQGKGGRIDGKKKGTKGEKYESYL